MIIFNSRFYLYFILLVLFSSKVCAQRIGESHEKWLSLSTPHFEIFYSAEHQDLSLYYAHIAELSYAEIMTIFTVPPIEKVVVILNDSTDSPNGFTTLLPYPYIMIYPVQAGRDDTLSESAEWAKELFVHELAHVFQLYPAEDTYKWIKPVFGTIIAPNLLMPLWWKEGMAVEVESRLSHQGRTRSYFQDASIRALVLENKLFQYTLAEANEALPSWPYGGRPYLFGSMFMSEIGFKTEGKALNQLTLGQAARLPYAIEAPHQRLFGLNYESHYLQTLSTYETHAQQQLQTLKSLPPSETTPIDVKLISSRHPRFDSTGTMLGLVTVDKKGRQISFYKKDSQSLKWEKRKYKKAPSGDISTFEFHPTESKIVFAKIDQVDAKRTFSDLYVFDLTQDKEARITRSARARNPIWSADGKTLYFISTFNGKTQINSINANTEIIEQLLELGYTERFHEIALYNPTELFISIRNNKGQLQSQLFDLTNRTLKEFKPISPEVEHLKNRSEKIYFTSIANGVSNIYLHKNKNEDVPMSHFLTGALDFDVHDDLGVATLHTTHGLQVHTFTPKPQPTLPQISNQFRERYKYQESVAPAFEAQTGEAKSLKYLYPHYWIPFIATSSANNSVYFQILTSGQDPLLIHRYNLSLDYDSYIDELGYNFDYINSAFRWPITFGAQKTFKPIGDTKIFIERSLTTLGFIPDTFKLSPKISMNAGMQISEIDQSDLRTQHVGPYLQAIYKDIKQTQFDIYPTGGWGTYLQVESLKAQDKDLSDFLGDYDQVTGSLLGYHSLWLPEDHSLYAKVSFLHTLQDVSTRFGTSNSVFPSITDNPIPDFLLRGYGVGQFFGSRLTTLNTEYRFPIKKIYKGNGTDPFFLKRLNGAIIVDGLTVSGGAFDKNDALTSQNMSESFWSTGAEVRLETTIGYLLPVNFILGFYQPLSPRYAEQGQMGLSLQIGGGLPSRD